jgi:uridine kinase
LATADNNIVIRGTLFNKNMIRYPRVETEYANTGIILLTGLFVLKNKDLEKINDFDILRDSFKQACNDFLLVTLLKKDGVSFNELKRLFQRFSIYTNLFHNFDNYFNNFLEQR